MLNDVYNRRIIELAGNIPRIGRLADPDATATAHSRLCGSTVTVELKMDGDKVTDFAHEVKACALGQAAARRRLDAPLSCSDFVGCRTKSNSISTWGPFTPYFAPRSLFST